MYNFKLAEKIFISFFKILQYYDKKIKYNQCVKAYKKC